MIHCRNRKTRDRKCECSLDCCFECFGWAGICQLRRDMAVCYWLSLQVVCLEVTRYHRALNCPTCRILGVATSEYVCVCVCNVDQTCLVLSEVELKWTSWPTWFHLCLCVCIVQIVSCSSNWNLRTRSVFAGSWRDVSARATSKGGKVHWQQSCEIVCHATFFFLAFEKFERARMITLKNFTECWFPCGTKNV